jgi:hypothetical protein
VACGQIAKNKTYCFGVGVAAAPSGVGVAFGSLRAFLRASTRWRRWVFFFAGDGDGDAVSVTAPFAGLGAGVGSAAKTLEEAIKPMAAARSSMCFIILYLGCHFSGVSVCSAEAWPTTPLLKAYGPTTACLGNQVQV